MSNIRLHLIFEEAPDRSTSVLLKNIGDTARGTPHAHTRVRKLEQIRSNPEVQRNLPSRQAAHPSRDEESMGRCFDRDAFCCNPKVG